MITEIRKNSDYSYTLYVNGRATVERESMTVCSNVKEALDHPERWEPTEAHEVADSIRAWIAKHSQTA